MGTLSGVVRLRDGDVTLFAKDGRALAPLTIEGALDRGIAAIAEFHDGVNDIFQRFLGPDIANLPRKAAPVAGGVDQLQAVADRRNRKQRQSSWPNVQSAYNRLHYRQTSSCPQNTATSFCRTQSKSTYRLALLNVNTQRRTNRAPPHDASEPAYAAAFEYMTAH